jgi:ElaA protein
MINWTYKHFNELSTTELYQILTVRNIVFVVEQNCVYLDTDDKDNKSWHLCGWDNGTLVAYARILPQGISYKEASIGRVVTHPDFRKKGYGKLLMKEAIEKTLMQFNTSAIKISAQLYLLDFYTSLGFKTCSEQYLEDDIPHIEMIWE